jgi:hypothetical protein
MNVKVASCFVVLVATTGCSSSVTDLGLGGSGGAAATTSSTGSGPTASDACAAYASALCARTDACSNGFLVKLWYGDATTCQARTTAACENALAADGTSATPSGTEACATALGAFACADLFDGKLPAECAAPPGKRANGTACAFSAQCQSDYCAIGDAMACGTCADKPTEGASCAATGECGAGTGLRCTPASVCHAPGIAGAACDPSTPCGYGLSCVGATATAVGHCQAAGSTVGAACSDKGVTAPECDATLGLRCKAMACVAIGLAGTDGACGEVAGVPTACSAAGHCVLPPASKTGTCEAAAADGAACDDTNGPTCTRPAHCVTSGASTAGKCTLVDAGACM